MSIYKMTATEIHDKVLKRELSCVEVVEDIFRRIDEVEDKVHSFVSLRREKALAEAKALDERIARNDKVGVLAGVPVALKDLVISKGDKVTACSKMLSGYESIYDSTVARKIKEADGIIIGFTNMDEFAMGGSTRTSCYHMTANPWDTDRVPGGSSGGSAAAVAASEAPISIGSDTGGSIRQPASFCGVVGIKPTYGRVSRYGIIAFASSLDQIGPFAKNVTDAALMLSVIAGSDDYDATVADTPVPDYLAAIGKPVSGLKIGVPHEYFVDGINSDVRAIVDKAIETYKSLGCEIVDISLPHTKYAIPTYYVLAPAEASSNLARYDGVRYGYKSGDVSDINDLYVNSRSEGFGDEVKRRIMIGTYVLSAGFYDAYFKKAQKVRALIKQDFDKALEQVDAILTPVTPNTAFKLSDVKTPLELYLEDIFTISANLAGLPGISIPAGLAQGLPVGVQLLGRPFGEETLFALGSAYEKARGVFDLPEVIK